MNTINNNIIKVITAGIKIANFIVIIGNIIVVSRNYFINYFGYVIILLYLCKCKSDSNIALSNNNYTNN